MRLVEGRTVVASVSGGKDSTAMVLHLRDLGVDFRAVFMDTGWEHPAASGCGPDAGRFQGGIDRWRMTKSVTSAPVEAA